MRLNQYISSSGLCSRREADKLIQNKKVFINNKPAEIGQTVGASDTVKIDGKIIKPKNQKVYIALNKPSGITCTTETKVKGNIIEFIGHNERIFPVGRLDKDSEGLIILTNDGNIVNKLLRQENKHDKEYVVTVDQPLTPEFIESMKKGVTIFNPVTKRHTKTKRCEIERLNKDTFKIILQQGLNRQIRRMCQALGYEVVKLKRVRITNLTLRDIPLGKWRYLTTTEVDTLLKSIEEK